MPSPSTIIDRLVRLPDDRPDADAGVERRVLVLAWIQAIVLLVLVLRWFGLGS